MSLDEVRTAEEIEIAACEDMVGALPRSVVEATGLRVERRGGALALIAPRIPTTLFNRALGLGVAEPATEGDVDDLVRLYRGAGIPAFWVHEGCASAPEALASWLEARGFVRPARRSWAKMLRDTHAPAPIESSLSVRLARSDEAGALAAVVGDAFEMPQSMRPWLEALVGRRRWEAFAALDGDRLVGGGMLFVNGPRGWLGIGAVLPSHRGRRGQAALMAARIARAAELGCEVVGTETGEPVANERNASLENMKRLGFRQVCSRRNFELRGS